MRNRVTDVSDCFHCAAILSGVNGKCANVLQHCGAEQASSDDISDDARQLHFKEQVGNLQGNMNVLHI